MDAEVVNMARLNVDRESTLPPKRVIDALIDFSARRPETWPGLAPEFYEVYSVGETSAYVKEGSAMSGLKIWAREHYDWSKPGGCVVDGFEEQLLHAPQWRRGRDLPATTEQPHAWDLGAHGVKSQGRLLVRMMKLIKES
jgi:hypothetical protein